MILQRALSSTKCTRKVLKEVISATVHILTLSVGIIINLLELHSFLSLHSISSNLEFISYNHTKGMTKNFTMPETHALTEDTTIGVNRHTSIFLFSELKVKNEREKEDQINLSWHSFRTSFSLSHVSEEEWFMMTKRRHHFCVDLRSSKTRHHSTWKDKGFTGYFSLDTNIFLQVMIEYILMHAGIWIKYLH